MKQINKVRPINLGPSSAKTARDNKSIINEQTEYKKLNRIQRNDKSMVMNTNKSEMSRKPLRNIEIEPNRQDIDRRLSFQGHQQNQKKMACLLRQQNQKLKEKNLVLEEQLKKYLAEQDKNIMMREQLQFRKEEQFQLLQHIRNFEKFNNLYQKQLVNMRNIIINYEQLSSQQYQIKFGKYDLSTFPSQIVYQVSEYSHNQFLRTNSEIKDSSQGIRKTFTVSILQDQDDILDKNGTDILNCTKSINQKQNHPITPKSQINIANSFRRKSLEPEEIGKSKIIP